MQSLIQWAISLTVVCALGAVILFMSPQSSVSKSVKTIVVLCVFTVFLTPVINASFSFKNDNITDMIESTDEDISEQMIKYACLEAEELCEDFVIKSGAQAQKIIATANIDNKNSIYITSIKIYLNEKYKDKTNDINEKIRNVFEIDGEYIWEKE